MMNRYGLSDQDLDKVYGTFEIISYGNDYAGDGRVKPRRVGIFKGYIHEILFSICENNTSSEYFEFKKIDGIRDIDGSSDLVASANVKIDHDTLKILKKNGIIKSYEAFRPFTFSNTVYTIYNRSFNPYKANKLAKEKEIGRILSKLNPDEIKFLREMDVLN